MMRLPTCAGTTSRYDSRSARYPGMPRLRRRAVFHSGQGERRPDRKRHTSVRVVRADVSDRATRAALRACRYVRELVRVSVEHVPDDTARQSDRSADFPGAFVQGIAVDG